MEIHAANGFLIDQFTRDSSNRRTDDYGGSIDNRLRFMLEVVAAVCAEIGAERVGIRLSPTNSTWGISDSQYQETFGRAAEQLGRFGLAYLHVLEPRPENGHSMHPTMDYLTPLLRERYKGTLLANGGYNKESGEAAVNGGLADAVVFGVPFIANPDLVERYRAGAELAEPDSTLFYTAGAAGYVDYEPLVSQAAVT